MAAGVKGFSRFLVFRLCLLLLTGCAQQPVAVTAPASSPAAELERIVANNARAEGAGAGIQGVEIHMAMQDGGSRFDAVYKATRDGRMRIDIIVGGKRVYTEAYDGERGWDMDKDGKVSVDPHGDALWHGTQFPGTLFSLAEMRANGHSLEYLGRETLDGVDYYVLKLTLSDGFETYRYVNPDTWLIDRGRDFRAFHPAVNGKKTWVETRWSDYRPVAGVLRAYRSVNVDLGTGKEIASQTMQAYLIDPGFDPAVFEMPPAAAE